MNSLLTSFFLILFSSIASAQDFRGENRVFIKFETASDGLLEYESNKFTIDLNKELNQVSFFVDLQTFQAIDNSSNMTMFNDIFQEELHPDITYKADLPSLKFDTQTDQPQQIDLNGTLWIGTAKTALPFRIELRMMDRFLFLDFDLLTTLSTVGIDIPEEYKKKISGKIHLQVLNAKLTEGFK
jgi:hypothetical protein